MRRILIYNMLLNSGLSGPSFISFIECHADTDVNNVQHPALLNVYGVWRNRYYYNLLLLELQGEDKNELRERTAFASNIVHSTPRYLRGWPLLEMGGDRQTSRWFQSNQKPV